MKVVVFAHTPPPHHGQSYMVELMLRGFADPGLGIECFHVNARFATGSLDIGRFRARKVFQLLGYCAQAVWLRFRHGAGTLYYVPAPTLRNALFRDWVILLLCRPFFSRVIFHWHAAGLGEWVDALPGWMRRVSHWALDGADLSISLGKFNELDAARFKPKRTALVGNGIPDPCPDYPRNAAARKARLAARRGGPAIVRVAYLSLCTRQKGFLDAIEGVVRANAKASALRFELTLAGDFLEAADEAASRETMARLGNPKEIKFIGFVTGADKRKLLEESDILCFPTYYYAESFGLVIVEAMAFGMPVLATRWRSIPELFPEGYPGLVEIKSPGQIAEALARLALRDDAEAFRNEFLARHAVERFLGKLAAAFRLLERRGD